jgi:hypothetical protein
MTLDEFYVVFPEGGCQEVPGSIGIDDLVDMNGLPLALPLPTARMIAYRVVKIRRTEERGIRSTYHYLELVPAFELVAFTR